MCLQFGKVATASNRWSFVLSVLDSSGYISIGFSPSKQMVGSSTVAEWATSTGSAGAVRWYYLVGMSSRVCPPDQGKLTLVLVPTNITNVVECSVRLVMTC
jgi:hypothetical protein